MALILLALQKCRLCTVCEFYQVEDGLANLHCTRLVYVMLA